MIYLNNFTSKLALSFLPITILGFFCQPALGQEYLTFKEPNSNKENYIIQQLANNLSEIIPPPYLLATPDLNDDSINEYIFKSASCNESIPCKHAIVAIRNDTPVILLTLDTTSILVLDWNDYGVRRIQATENNTNDYQKTTYQWSPKTFTYNKQ